MKTKPLAYLLLLSFLLQPVLVAVSAQSFALSGTVVNYRTSLGVDNAVVTAESLSGVVVDQTFTDPDGSFTFEALPRGLYKLRFEKGPLYLPRTRLVYVTDDTDLAEWSVFPRSYTPLTFASGLAFPIGLTYGPDGELYVVETAAGIVSRFSSDGEKTVVVTGLPFMQFGEEAVGAWNLAFSLEGSAFPSGLYLTVGLFGPGLLGTVLFVSSEDLAGNLPVVVDESNVFARVSDWSFQFGNAVLTDDSNPYDLTFDPLRDLLYLSNAGADEILAITSNGDISSLAAFDFAVYEGHAAPTGLAVSPDGSQLFFTGLGTAAGFPLADVRIIDLDTGEMDIYLSGFFFASDIAFDSKGRLYLLEGFKPPFFTEGDVLSLSREPDWVAPLAPLVGPMEIAFSPSGHLFVTEPFTGRIMMLYNPSL